MIDDNSYDMTDADIECNERIITDIFKKIPKGFRSNMTITTNLAMINMSVRGLLVFLRNYDDYVRIQFKLQNFIIRKDFSSSKQQIIERDEHAKEIECVKIAEALTDALCKKFEPNKFIKTYDYATIYNNKYDQFNPRSDSPLLELRLNIITISIKLIGVVYLCDKTFTICKAASECEVSDKKMWLYFTAVSHKQTFNFISDGEIYHVVRDYSVVECAIYHKLTLLDKEIINELIKKHIEKF